MAASSTMTTSGLTSSYRCGYCYEEFNSMVNPRELPCHHVFCLPCLKGDYHDNGDASCPTCQ